jgi:hypothetical protein
MYPLNEVSTDQGRNMRETCARVLAAALMTGAIAAVVAMSALVGAPSQSARPITAPPSSLERSVRIVALPAPRPHRASVRRPVSAHQIRRPVVRPSVLARRFVTIHPRATQPTRRRLASNKPKAAPVAPTVSVQGPVAEPPPPASVPAPQTEEPASQDDHGNGHAYGHEKEHGHGHEGRED